MRANVSILVGIKREEKVMKQLSMILIGVFITFSAFADKTPTSKSYVDAQVGTLQDTVPAVDTNTVLTTTDTNGEIGEKAIYDSTQNYAAQQDALVTAEDANAAIQNGIDAELVCSEWNPNDPTDCWVYDVVAAKPQNLLDPAHIHQGTISSGTNIGYTNPRSPSRCYFDYIPVHAGDIVNLTSKAGTPPVYDRLWLYTAESESTYQQLLRGTSISVVDNVGYKWTIPSDGYVRGIWLQEGINFTPEEVVQPMLEISSTPHEYVPYKVSMPSGN